MEKGSSPNEITNGLEEEGSVSKISLLGWPHRPSKEPLDDRTCCSNKEDAEDVEIGRAESHEEDVKQLVRNHKSVKECSEGEVGCKEILDPFVA